ncbi:hypothetical protein [Leeuwenhoekiella sp. NPDC079379]|uniref:hypothetical protein n=1 Tax=Leeuwenhoekiella sp. NPDC079379 TaxID=3364122 RepID=UPI0037CAFC34
MKNMVEEKMSAKRLNFLDKYGEHTDSETLKEILYAQMLQIEKLEKIRSNTSSLVWWLIAIPILCVILIFALGGLGVMF